MTYIFIFERDASMKRSKKHKWFKRFFAFIIIFILILIGLRNFNQYINKNRIKKLVNNKMDFLNECVEDENYNKIYELKEVKDIRKWSLDKDEIYIDFFCRGYGIVSNSTYIGFYYISDNKPTGFQGYPHELKARGKGWQWNESNGDNWYYTEKIDDYWYYYEAGF